MKLGPIYLILCAILLPAFLPDALSAQDMAMASADGQKGLTVLRSKDRVQLEDALEQLSRKYYVFLPMKFRSLQTRRFPCPGKTTKDSWNPNCATCSGIPD